MPKEKKITLYSRNGCKMSKTTNIDMTKWNNIRKNRKLRSYSTKYAMEKVEEHDSWRNKKKETIIYERHESPLGFWYMVPKETTDEFGEPKKDPNAIIKKIELLVDGTLYEMEYPTEYHDVKIGIEARPWDILPGYQGIPGHMVNALYRETQKFFDSLESYLKIINVTAVKFKELKKSTMVDLFGITGKPESQPNDIKILSHGFDLKTSFRKAPEK